MYFYFSPLNKRGTLSPTAAIHFVSPWHWNVKPHGYGHSKISGMTFYLFKNRFIYSLFTEQYMDILFVGTRSYILFDVSCTFIMYLLDVPLCKNGRILSFFQFLQCWCITGLGTVWNKSWKQHPRKQRLYGYLSPIAQNNQERWTRLTEHCWGRNDELISDILLWTPAHGCACVGRPAKTNKHHLCRNTRCSLKDQSGTKYDKDGWRESGNSVPVLLMMMMMMIYHWIYSCLYWTLVCEDTK